MIDDPAKALAFWIAAVMGRPDICAEIMLQPSTASNSHPHKAASCRLRIVAAYGHRINEEGFQDD